MPCLSFRFDHKLLNAIKIENILTRMARCEITADLEVGEFVAFGDLASIVTSVDLSHSHNVWKVAFHI